MKYATKFLTAALAAATVSAFAGGANLYVPGGATRAEDANSWTANPKKGPWGKVNSDSLSGKGSIECSLPKGWAQLVDGSRTEVDSTAVYKVKLALKGKAGLKFRMGIIFYDKNKKMIDVMDYAPADAPIYTLAKDANPGDKTITLDQPVSYIFHWAAAFNAKADGSDIPNREHCNLKPTGKKTEKSAVLELQYPLKKGYAKGTAVRLQKRHELAFCDVELTGDWKEFSFLTTKSRALLPQTKYISFFLQTSFPEPQTILIDSPVIEKVSAQ